MRITLSLKCWARANTSAGRGAWASPAILAASRSGASSCWRGVTTGTARAGRLTSRWRRRSTPSGESWSIAAKMSDSKIAGTFGRQKNLHQSACFHLNMWFYGLINVEGPTSVIFLRKVWLMSWRGGIKCFRLNF